MNKYLRKFAPHLAASLLFLVAGYASSAPVTVPTDLNVGDQYRLVFFALFQRDGGAGSTDIAEYNDFVTSVANMRPELAALDVEWKVIASTAAVSARDNTSTAGGGGGTHISLK